jgi:hypothetical protein
VKKVAFDVAAIAFHEMTRAIMFENTTTELLGP